MEWQGIRLGAIALLIGACNSGSLELPESMPGQKEAIEIIWRLTYHEEANPPIIYWITGAALECSNGDGYWDPNDPTSCIGGQLLGDRWAATIAWPRDNKLFSDTAIAHELCHAHWWLKTGNVDGLHGGPCFVGPDALYKIANRNLKFLGY